MKAKAEVDGLEFSQDPRKWQEIMENHKTVLKLTRVGGQNMLR